MKHIKKAIERTEEDKTALARTVSEIIANVRENGDDALAEYNRRFDDCNRQFLQIAPEEIEEAYSLVDEAEIADIKRAAANIEAFAKAQKDSMKALDDFQPEPGIHLGHKRIPVESCCCYVPGGGYPLYSTALMLGIPARVAGVKRIAACSPTMKGTGKIHPKTLVAMDVAGVDEIYAVGGAQAVAAFDGDAVGGRLFCIFP